MTKNRPFNGRVIASVALLQQLALSSPAMANAVHGAVGGPWQNLGPHNSGPVMPLAGGASAGFLPAAFGHGVAQLPLAHQTLPLNHPGATLNFMPVVRPLANFSTVSTVKLSPLQSIQLDLTSADSSISLGTQTVKSGQDVTVMIGGTATTFHSGEKVTAAELVAIEQAQTRTGQTITLNNDGVAVGGSFSLNGVTSPSTGVTVTGIVVPGNVTAVDKVSAHANVNLSGDLVNYGSIVEIGRGNSSANLSALDIVNEANASISTVSHGGKGTDLNLTAVDSLTNSGTITSSGSLSLNAPQITNSGTVTATTGAVTLTSGQGVNLNVNNAGGTITAASAINIRETGYAGNGTTSVSGGDLISQQVNINAGQAIANVNVNKLTGEVVSVGEGVHVSANTDTLVLGKQCLTGDPTFYNTGNIIINGNLSAAEDLSIIAEGSVFGTSSLTSITVNDGNSGKDLTIIAGANISGSTGSTSPNLPIAPGPNTATIDLGSSGLGGNIDFTASSSLAISTNAPSATHNGGNIVLAAYEGLGGVGGAVVLPTTTTITAAGNGGGSINGDVTILARAPLAGTVISVGTISGARNVIVANFGMTSSDGKPVTFAADGSISSSNTLAPAYGGSSNLGDVNIGNITATGNVTLFAGGTLTLTGPVFGPGTTIATANGDVNIAFGVAGGTGVLIGAGGNVTATSATSITAHNSVGPANIVISAGAALQVSSGMVTFFSPSTTGGNVNLSAVTAINTSATTGNNSGGSITIGATAVNSGTGKIDIGSAALTTGGIGSGGGGDVTLTAALTGGVAIVMPASISFGGGSAASGNLNLHTAQPLNPNAAVDTTTMTFTPGGNFSGGQTTSGSIDLGKSSQVNMAGGALTYNVGGDIIGTTGGGITGLASTVTISAGTISMPFIGVSQAALTVSASGDLTGTNTINAKSAFITAGGAVSLSDITAPQQVTVVAGNGLSVGAVSSNSASGDAGPVTLISGAQFSTAPGASVTISGANIGLLFDLSFKSINTTSTAGNGGNVIISAFSGDGSSGTISATSVSGISTAGNSSFKNGDVIINSANSTTAFSAVVPLNVSTVNSKSSGDITLTNTVNDLPINIVIDTAKGLVTTGSLEGSTNAGGTATFGALFAGGNVKILAGPVTLNGPVGGAGSLVNVDSTGDINLIGSSTAQSVSFAAKGSINLSGNLSEFAGISLVAGQNISTLINGLTFTTTSATSTGDITLVAGAAFSTSDTTITVTGPSASGGNIDLATHALSTLSTQTSVNAGSINLIAFATNGGSTGGQVLSTANIVTGSTGSGTNGDVVVVAGSNSAAIQGPFNVFTHGGASVPGTGNVTLAAAAPNASAGSPINITRIGAAPSASFVGGAATTGSVAFNMIGTNQATVTIEDGTALTISSPAPTAASLILQSLDNVIISTALNNNSVAIFAGKSIQIGASITSPGGIALIANQDIKTTTAGLTISTSSGGANSGALTIIAGANFNTSLTGATVNGGSLTGGQINLSDLTALTTSNTGAGSGGNISLATFTGSNKTSDIVLNSAGNLQAGAVTSTGGSVTIVGGGTSSVTLGQVTTNDSTITIENATPQTVTVANNGTVTGFLNPSGGFTTGTINSTTISSTGGRITVETGGNLKINSIDASNSNAFGGTVTIVSGSTSNNLQIGTVIGLNYVGAVNTSGSFSVGGAGSLDIESTGGAGLTFANASNIQFAGSTLISAPSLTFVATGSTLDLGTFQGGNISVTSVTGAGGGVTLTADTINYATMASAPLKIDASGLTSSGTIFLTLDGTTPYTIANKAGGFVLTSTGGTVRFIADNAPLSVDGSAITVSAAGAGGRIDLRADGFSGAVPIVLNANGTSGSAGSFNISDLSTTETLTIGGGNGQFTLNATGTSGGSITVDGQAIVVNPLNIAAAPTSSKGTGADLEFYSNSTLVVNGALSADGGASGGNGGTIILQANSPTSFTTGAAGKIVNGVGALSAAGAGGQIKITNNAGSIINSGAITKFALLDEQVSGAKSVITINNTLGVDNTSEIDLGSDAGAISSAKAITTGVFDAESTSGAITFSKLNATDITALSGNTKTSNVTITNVGIGTTNINLLQGNNISFKSAGNITASKSIDASGTVAVSTTAKTGATIDLNDVTALSTVTVSSTGSMSFGHVDGTKGVKFSNKDVGASINLNDNVGSTAGTISITAPGAITSAAGIDMSAAKGVTLTSSKGAITIATVGVAGATSALTATAFTSVTTLDTVSATTTITLKATDKTAGSGLVNIQGPMTVASTKGSLTLTAGAAGLVNDASAADGTKVSAGKITVTAPGGATFNHLNMNTTGSTLAITAAKGGVTIGSNASLGSFSTVTLTGLTDVTNHGQITGATGVTASSKGIDGKTGTLTSDGSITASGAAAKVTLTTTGNLQQNGTIMSGSDVNLKASVGSLSTSAGSTTTSTNGKVILSAPNNLDDLGALSAKTNISVTTTAKLQANTLTVGNLNTSEGNISVIGAGGLVNTTSGAMIKASSSLTKTKATLLIEDSNITKGINSAISIDGILSTFGPGGGNVSISIGAPGTGKNPSTSLTGFTISNTGGTVFAGATPSALIVTGAGKAALTTQGKNIILTSPSALSTITFTSTSSVTADPPVNGTGVANAVSNVAAPIRIMPVIEAAPLAPTSSNNIIRVDTVPIASAATDSASLNAFIANSRTISGGVSYNDEWPISGFIPSPNNSTSQSYNQNSKWISPTELDGGTIPAVFIGQGDRGDSGYNNMVLADNEAAANSSRLERNSSDQITMHSGTALVSPSQDMTIETPHGKVFVAARALAIVMALPNGLAVYNLHDLKGRSVGIERDGKRIDIAPASATIFVADKRAAFADVNPAQLVCYGRLNEMLQENGKLFTAEFSLPTAINAMPMLKDLIASKDKQAARIAGAFLKTVAIMQTLSGPNYQNFRQHVRPVMTACK